MLPLCSLLTCCHASRPRLAVWTIVLGLLNSLACAGWLVAMSVVPSWCEGARDDYATGTQEERDWADECYFKKPCENNRNEQCDLNCDDAYESAPDEQCETPGTVDDWTGMMLQEAIKPAIIALLFFYIFCQVSSFKAKSTRDCGVGIAVVQFILAMMSLANGQPGSNVMVNLGLGLWYAGAVYSLGKQMMAGTITRENPLGAPAAMGMPQIQMQVPQQPGFAQPGFAQPGMMQAVAVPVQPTAVAVHAQAMPMQQGMPVAAVVSVAKP